MPCVTKYSIRGTLLEELGELVSNPPGYESKGDGKWASWRVCEGLKLKKSDLTDHQKAIDTKGKHMSEALPADNALKRVVQKHKADERQQLEDELRVVSPLADLEVTLAVEEIAVHKIPPLLQWAEKHGMVVIPHLWYK
ncbi:hypothetical protein FOL47_007610 [Perkinsus chesapeaki]|uniref:Uncharacterized protein n=1 Tax=Perkinsus chesapeaki TaxID=330153 RepID=A0A7J6LJ92_PERCH|nr:hypothetical protein FOL47_007610 [Perkinsus chesapeaki]